jgi:hypothetical protein
MKKRETLPFDAWDIAMMAIALRYEAKRDFPALTRKQLLSLASRLDKAKPGPRKWTAKRETLPFDAWELTMIVAALRRFAGFPFIYPGLPALTVRSHALAKQIDRAKPGPRK